MFSSVYCLEDIPSQEANDDIEEIPQVPDAKPEDEPEAEEQQQPESPKELPPVVSTLRGHTHLKL